MFAVKPEFPQGYYLGIDFYLWIVSIILCICSLLLFMKRRNESEHSGQRALFRGLGFLFFFLGLMRVSYLIGVRGKEENYDFWINFGYTLGIAGMGSFLYEVERAFLKKTKYVLTILNTAAFIISILAVFNVIPRKIPLNVATYVSTADMGLIFVFYIYFIYISPGELKRRGLFNLLGMILTFLGVSMDSELFFITLWPTMPLWLPPLLAILGN